MSALRAIPAALLLWFVANDPCAVAATRFVDGACESSGTGDAVTCGTTGPFRTIAEGVRALQPGDTLDVRGAHDGFSGAYFESVVLRDGGALPGKAVACTAAEPCVIEGCRKPGCPADEVPIIRGMALHRDWTAVDGGVWHRTMERTPDPDDQLRDEFDPMFLVEEYGPGKYRTLGYAGDNFARMPEGEWSYDPTTHTVHVHPAKGADPRTTIWVPHYTHGVDWQSPTQHLTLQHMTIEGTRSRGVDIAAGSVATPIEGAVLRHLKIRFIHRFFVLTTLAVPGFLAEDNLLEYGCRGDSSFFRSGDGCFGLRLFHVNGGAARRNTMRHMGAAGRFRLSCGPACTKSWPCAWCDAPWNDPGHTYWSSSGTPFQVKQTEGFTVEDNVAEDYSSVGFAIDASRKVTMQRNTARRGNNGFVVENYTPSQGCPTTSPGRYCYACDALVQRNTAQDLGRGNGWWKSCAYELNPGPLHTDCTFYARLVDNVTIPPYESDVCSKGSSPTLGASGNRVQNRPPPHAPPAPHPPPRSGPPKRPR